VTEFQLILNVGLIVGGIAYAVGQVISSRKRGQSDALALALQEIEVIRGKADRMDKELTVLQAQVHSLEKENATLRQLLVTRNDLDEKLITRVTEAFEKQTRRLVDVLREGKVA
jgi:cell shape-determining protein MreC